MQRAVLILLVLAVWPAPARPADSMAWTNDQAMLFFFEAATRIKQHGLGAPGVGEIAPQALDAYLRQQDPYGRFLSADQYGQWQKSQNYRFHGVGMEILDREGAFFCLPFPDSPALEAGVRSGDTLAAVDGAPVSGQSLMWAGSRIRGEPGTTVRLTLVRNGRELTLNVPRKPLRDRSVWPAREGGLQILRISHFSSHTLSEMKAALAGLGADAPLVLDLRDNPGGDLFAAVDLAGLFLAPGARILTIETNRDSTDYNARGQVWKGRRLALWQNRFTASAAEVLISALAGNGQGLTLGTPSFGKAMTQRVIPLSDGSALVLSQGKLFGPRGTTWQGKGLSPAVSLPDDGRSWAGATRERLK